MTRRALSLVMLVTCLCGQAWGVEFYSATTPRFFNPLDVNSMYYNVPGTRPRILFDDITVPFSAPTSRFQVTKVTVKISRTTGAPAVTVSPYYSVIVPNNVYNGGASDFPDFPDVAPPTAFGSPQNLAAMGGAPFTETTLSFGTGSSTLFIVPGSTAALVPGKHSFAIGLDLSNADSRNGWTIAQQANNLDLLWDYVSSTNFAEFTYDVDSQSNFIVGTQYLRVEGQVVSGLNGDANADGRVDVLDLISLANNWLGPADFSGGDFNFDGIVNQTDLGLMAINWQASATLAESLPGVGLGDVSVPEPAAMSLAILALPFIRRRRR